MRYKYILISLFLVINICNAQDKINVLDFNIVDDDSIFISDLPEVKILEFKDVDEKRQYYILKRKVLKVYPYALLAKKKLIEMEEEMELISRKRKKRRYAKKRAAQMKDEHANELKGLTMSEGRILVKLIHRETDQTTFDIVKLYRGRFNAFFWQTMAKFWDNDLKNIYDPLNSREDMLIEHILIQANKEKNNN